MSLSELTKRLKYIKSFSKEKSKLLLEHINDIRFWDFAKTQ